MNQVITHNKSSRLKELDAFRGIAAFVVVLFHFDTGRFSFYIGKSGVYFFFLISGFVIFMTLQRIKTGKEFWISRISRLYPAYWFTCTIIMFKQLIIEYFIPNSFEISFINYVGNLSMFQWYFNIKDLNVVFWTLVVEFQFYGFIFLFYKLKKLSYIKHFGLITTIYGLLLIFVFPEFYKDINNKIILIFYLPLFISGIIFFESYQEKKISLQNYFYLLIFLVCQIIILVRKYNETYSMIYPMLIYYGLFILFIYRRISFIVNGVLLFLGRISYSLYLTHLVFSLTILKTISKYSYSLIGIISAILFSIFFAYLITDFIENPLSKKLSKFLKKT